MLARLLQEEYGGTEPSFWPEDEDFARKLQAEYDNEQDVCIPWKASDEKYPIEQPSTSNQNVTFQISDLTCSFQASA